MSPRAALLALLASASAACVGGPDSCFRPPSIVDTSRILAVRVDPPEALVDLDAGESPTVRVRVLFAGHGNFARQRVAGSLCAPTPDLTCPAGSFEVPSGALSEPGAFEAETTFEVPSALIAAAREADPLRGYGGIRVLLDVSGFAGPRRIRAGKLLLFTPRTPAAEANKGLEIDRVSFLNGGVATAEPQSGEAVLLDVAGTYGVRPHLAPADGVTAQAEEYDIVDLAGRLVHLRERVTWSFFTTEQMIFGDLTHIGNNPVATYRPGADVADEPAPGAAEPADGLVRMTVLDEAQTWLWVVARDGRGGVAWTQVRLNSLDQRASDRKADLRMRCVEKVDGEQL